VLCGSAARPRELEGFVWTLPEVERVESLLASRITSFPETFGQLGPAPRSRLAQGRAPPKVLRGGACCNSEVAPARVRRMPGGFLSSATTIPRPSPAMRRTVDFGEVQQHETKGDESVGYEDLKILDVSRITGQWTPPIGAMGGPPAHELYKDLVLHAGLQLFRDVQSRPWVALLDGAQRRAFPVPSTDLRSAIDRFRMRRNLRPVPPSDIEEFVRIVEARISDPDVEIPVLRSPLAERTTVAEPDPPPPPVAREPPERWKVLNDQIDSALRDIEALEHEGKSQPAPAADPPPSHGPENDGAPLVVREVEVDPSISGGRRLPESQNGTLARYVRVFRELVHEGGWMGSTRELSELTRDDPLVVFDSLLKYRSELANNDILIANIEVGGSYQWLAVDRSKIRTGGEAPSASDRLVRIE
jgi:hypothetical protein